MRDRHKRRVAAYCRVSTRHEEQEESFENQVRYYTGYIASHGEWEYAGVYADEKSGVRAENRPGFQQLIRDALDGRIDYILVKSISRFSRNLVDCKRYTGLLKGQGCYVYFEKEGLDTADPASAMMFSFLSVIAQDESRSISDNVKWGYKERYQRGAYNLGSNRLLGYDCENGVLKPNADAAVVEKIFGLYLAGRTPGEIASFLNGEGSSGNRGKAFGASGIRYILSNEAYIGDKLLQKRPPGDFLTGRAKMREGFAQHYVESDHPALIDRAVWEKAQSLLQINREQLASGVHPNARSHPLYGRVYCGSCGAPLMRKTRYQRDKSVQKVWVCRGRDRGSGCRLRSVKEEELLAEISRQCGMDADTITPEQVLKEVWRVDVGQKEVYVIRRRGSE